MEPELLGHLFDRHAAPLLLYARQWCRAPEDVVQDAFLKLAALDRTPERPVPYLYRMVRNAALNMACASRRRRQHETAAAAQVSVWFTAPELTSLDAETATAALQGLPLEQREAIIAHLWGGLTFEQIGEVMGTSASTAYRTYGAGLSALRERLGVSCPKQTETPS